MYWCKLSKISFVHLFLSRKCRDEGGMEKVEGVWLCAPCVKDTKLWHREDFDFEEEDR